MRHLTSDDPRRVGPYRIAALLGVGGMGRVYLGLDRDDRPAAVKVVRAEHAYDPDFRERFAQEIDLARSARGRGIPRVFDADTSAEIPWLATEYVMGPSLQHLVDTAGPLPEPSAVHLARGIAQALTDLHAQGLAHRDLKPANVMIAPTGPQVIDFGIARAMADTHRPDNAGTVGTPGYMAPEIIRGRQSGPPVDVFAFGAVLVLALTGTGPFGDGHPSSVLFRADKVGPDLSGVPESLRPLAAACLDRDPVKRPTAAQVLHALGGPVVPAPAASTWLPPTAVVVVDSVAHDHRWARSVAGRSAKRRGLLTVGAAGAALALLAGFTLWTLHDPFSPTTEAATEDEEAVDDDEPVQRDQCDPTEHLADEFVEAAADEPTVPTSTIRMYTEFSHDGSVLAVSGSHGVALWDWAAGQELALINSHQRKGDSAPRFSPDDCFIGWGTDRGAYVYSLETGEQTVYAEGRDIQDLAFSPDGEVITVVDGEHDHEGSIYDIDPSTGETVFVYPNSSAHVDVSYSPEGEHIAATSALGAPTVWDTETGEKVFDQLSGHRAHGRSIHLAGDGQVFFSHEEGPVHHDFVEGGEDGWLFSPEEEEPDGNLVEFFHNPLADRLYAVYMEDEPGDDGTYSATLAIWEFGDDPTSTTEEIEPRSEELPLHMSVHPEGEVVSAAHVDGEIVMILAPEDLRELDRLG